MNIYGDTMNLSHTINDLQRNGLKSDSFLYTTNGGYDYELDKYLYLHPKVKDYSQIPEEILVPYSIEDPVMSLIIHRKQIELIQQMDINLPLENGWGLERYYTEIVVPYINIYLESEVDGLTININQLLEIEKEYRYELEKAEDTIEKLEYELNELNKYIEDIESGEVAL